MSPANVALQHTEELMMKSTQYENRKCENRSSPHAEPTLPPVPRNPDEKPLEEELELRPQPGFSSTPGAGPNPTPPEIKR